MAEQTDDHDASECHDQYSVIFTSHIAATGRACCLKEEDVELPEGRRRARSASYEPRYGLAGV